MTGKLMSDPATAEPRFQDPAPGARSTRAQVLDAAGATFGLYRIAYADPPVYLTANRGCGGPLVFALQRTAPHPTRPETWAVYREITPVKPADAYPLDLATPLAD